MAEATDYQMQHWVEWGFVPDKRTPDTVSDPLTEQYIRDILANGGRLIVPTKEQHHGES